MRESISYQIILEEERNEGRLAEARRNVLDIGSGKFGAPDSATTAQIERITDIGLLHQMMRRVFHVSTWQELLALPGDCSRWL